MGSLLLLGIGLLLLPRPDPTLLRLRWIVSNRVAAAPADEPNRRFPGLDRLRSARRAVTTACAVGCAVLVTCCLGPVPGALTAACCWALSRVRAVLAAERAQVSDRGELSAGLAALTEEYAAGANTAAAFTAAAPVAGRFAPALAEAGVLAGYGARLEGPMSGEPALAPLAVASALAHGSGASLANLLAGVRTDLAADQETRRAVGTAVAGPRASAVLLAGLPVIGIAMGTAIGAAPGSVLLRTPIGLAALSAGVLLDLAGLLWTLILTRQPAS